PSPKSVGRPLGSSALAADDDEVVPVSSRRNVNGANVAPIGQGWGSPRGAAVHNGAGGGPWGTTPPPGPRLPPIGSPLWSSSQHPPQPEPWTPGVGYFTSPSTTFAPPSPHSGV